MLGQLAEPRKLEIGIRTYLPSEILGVALGERGPFFRQVIEGEDRRHRANRAASAAVDTLHRIDVQHLFCRVFFTVLFGMDAIHRTSLHTGGVLGSNARFCNYVCHRVICLPEECGTTEPNIVARKRARGTKKANGMQRPSFSMRQVSAMVFLPARSAVPQVRGDARF